MTTAEDERTDGIERVLVALFKDTFPLNSDLNQILIKVSTLNTLYSTQLRNYAYPVAKHILNLKIDDRLKAGDLTLVNDILNTPLENGKIYHCYSFATKYCSFHRPDIYPIYDSYVDAALIHLASRDGFMDSSKINNKDYISYCAFIDAFRKHSKMDGLSLKEIDKYLWQIGYDLKHS